MTRQVRQLMRLIDDLMDVARIARGTINVQLSPTAVNLAVEAAVEAVQPLVSAYGHRLTVSLPPQAILVNADAARLTQILSNLLNNAAKYTPKRGEIFVTVERTNGSVVMRVRDNGPGISSEQQREIFEPFRQMGRMLTRSHGGLGIGLMLAKRLTELQGGTISVHSEGVGRGAEFAVSLPVGACAAETVETGENPWLPTESDLPHLRVLVVDDLAESGETLARLLQQMGQQATAITSPSAALDWSLEHRPDIAFLDIAMPDMDGYELARRIRQCPELKKTMLVALTGFGQRRDRRKSLDCGFDHHMTKPATASSLAKLLRSVPQAQSNLQPVA